MAASSIRRVSKLDFPWQTADPFLFCVYHQDFYPPGNGQLGVTEDHLSERRLGNDFTIKDGFRMYHGYPVPGFPKHPHRGFETITVVNHGLIDHCDSMGATARYGNGDTQWMTAGKGIQHCEMFPLLNEDKGNHGELFQIWINLPARSKMVDPYFTMFWKHQTPIVDFKDDQDRCTSVRIVAGHISGLEQELLNPPPDSWASDPENEVAVWTIEMEPEAQWTLPPSNGETNRSLFYYVGDGITAEDTAVSVDSVMELEWQQEIKLKNGTGVSKFLFLQGRPINEPVAQYGPFVMNTMDEIQMAYRDYQKTEFGGWPWPSSSITNGRKGRHAVHPDGRLDSPDENEDDGKMDE